jgi:hypothetical protein
MTQGVLDALRRRGILSQPSRLAVRDKGYLCSWRIDPCRTQPLPHPSSVQPTAVSMRRFARDASRSGGLRRPTLDGLVPPQNGDDGCARGSLPAFLRKREGCRMPSVPKGARGKRGPTQSEKGRKSLPPRRARIGRSRSCSRVVDCCRSRQTVAGAEKRTLPISPDLESVRGRAPSPLLQRTKVRSGGRRDTGTLIAAEASRDRSPREGRRAQGAGGCRSKALRIVWLADLHGPPACHGLGPVGIRRFAMSEAMPRRSDGSVRGPVASGSERKKTPHANLELPA